MIFLASLCGVKAGDIFGQGLARPSDCCLGSFRIQKFEFQSQPLDMPLLKLSSLFLGFPTDNEYLPVPTYQSIS